MSREKEVGQVAQHDGQESLEEICQHNLLDAVRRLFGFGKLQGCIGLPLMLTVLAIANYRSLRKLVVRYDS